MILSSSYAKKLIKANKAIKTGIVKEGSRYYQNINRLDLQRTDCYFISETNSFTPYKG